MSKGLFDDQRIPPNKAHSEPTRFDGKTYIPSVDRARLMGQMLSVFTLVKDGRWRTLDEISQATGAPQASVSARLRDLRKERFGGYDVQRRWRGEPEAGLYEYRILILLTSETPIR